MFRFSPDAMTVTRLKDGQILDVNDGFTQITGFLPAEVIGRSTGDLDLGAVLPVSSPSGENGVAPVRNAQVRVRTKTGEERLGLCSTEVVIVGGEQCLLSVTRDVSDRQRAEEALQEANRQLAQWVADLETRSREISLLNDLSGVLQSCVTPDEACAVAVQFGQQLLPRSEGAICRFAEVGGVLEVVAAWGDLPTGTMFTPLECWALRRGRPYAVSDASTGLACAHVQDRTGSGYVCVPLVAQGETLGVLHVRDLDDAESAEVSESRHPDATLRLAEALAAHVGLALANLRLREKLRRQSVRDELTGLYNRRYMEESLERELFRARRASGSLSVALLDLDGFKGVNDGYGHDAGDDLLKVVGQILRTFVRAGDIVCRYGGDEFLFVLPAMELSAAYDRVGEIRAAISKAVVWHQGQAILPVSASAGVVAFPNHGQTAAHLLSAADAALYRAKTRGGNSSEAGPSLGASPQHAA
jgi:diguanylate cyclase (GGDEF)-like protein/PAS domain S-box-containing protein